MIRLSELGEQEGLMKIPAGAAEAWASLDALSRCYYRPLIYLGREDTDAGAQFWFIARQTVIFPTPENRLVLLAISEHEEEYAVGAEPTLVLAA